MKSKLFLIGSLIILAVVSLGVTYVLRPPATASEPIEAVTLSEETAVSSDTLLFEITQNASQVTFDLDEDLRGQRVTVLGVTDQVAGQISLNPTDLTELQVGTIQINARTLTTDNEFRNRAIQNEILETDSYEYITFEPTAVSGLPNSVAIGETVTFAIRGNLTIRDITQEVAFNVTATLVTETELSGTASASILRDDFNLAIPSVPSVANVDEAIQLTITFAATA